MTVDIVTYNLRTYRKKVHWLSRTILKSKRKLQMLRREMKTADGRTTLQSVEKKIIEILAESYIAPVFAVRASQDNNVYRMPIRTDSATIRDYRAHFGENIIFTDHIDWATEEIVRAYRDRYKIELAFRWTKDPMLVRWQPMYHWTDSQIRVHGLVCVMSLLHLSLLGRRLHRAGYSVSLDREPVSSAERARLGLGRVDRANVLTRHSGTFVWPMLLSPRRPARAENLSQK